MTDQGTTTDPLAGLSADELLRVLGHEIGNLVTIVSGYGQMLREHWTSLDDDKRLDIVGRMNRQVDQLRVLIDNFQHLRWLTVSAPDLDDFPVRTDMSDLITALADDLVPLADDHPLVVDVEPDLPPVYADRASVQHVLMNLVVNATKFSSHEAPIDISVRREDDWVRFTVTDRGPGVAPDMRDRVFHKFVRLQEGGVGVGLGLFICRSLVEAMGGRIWVEDADDVADGGARFVFLLPVVDDASLV
jgi:signal transduction histidine kinase